MPTTQAEARDNLQEADASILHPLTIEIIRAIVPAADSTLLNSSTKKVEPIETLVSLPLGELRARGDNVFQLDKVKQASWTGRA